MKQKKINSSSSVQAKNMPNMCQSSANAAQRRKKNILILFVKNEPKKNGFELLRQIPFRLLSLSKMAKENIFLQ